jgi:hypothetical protein
MTLYPCRQCGEWVLMTPPSGMDQPQSTLDDPHHAPSLVQVRLNHNFLVGSKANVPKRVARVSEIDEHEPAYRFHADEFG